MSMTNRNITVNSKHVNIPLEATAKEIIALALLADIKPSQWGKGRLELREYEGSGARLLRDNDIPKGIDFGLREVDPKQEPGFRTLQGWDLAVVATYPEYVQKALKGEGSRHFSGSWDEGTIGPPGFMTPHQISGASYARLVHVYTMSGSQWYEIPEARWVNEYGEPNPYQANGKFLLTIEDALPYVEAFRKYRAYRRDRFAGGLPPEMHGLSDDELRPIRDYIAHMKAKERAGQAGPADQGFGVRAHGSDYVRPKPVVVSRETVARAWSHRAGRVETLDEAFARVTKDAEARVVIAPEVRLPIPMPISEKALTPFKRGWNRFFKATGYLPDEVSKLTVKWDGFLRIRLHSDYVDDFGELLGADINGFDLTLRRHRSGKYYQVKLDAPTMKAVVEYGRKET